MNSITRLLLPAVLLCALQPGHALVTAKNLADLAGKTALVSSRLTVRVGAQWIDVEEEDEVEVSAVSDGSKGPWILEGTFSVPNGTAVTGCMIWNDDTLLTGKLRGKADNEHIFDSLVPQRDSAWARDPLLIEQTAGGAYNLQLFPFQTGGSRRFRIRYLVPLPAGASELSIKPLAVSFLSGPKPEQFELNLRGAAKGVKIVRGANAWPVELPSYQLVDLDSATDVRLRWPEGPAGDGTCAIRGRIDSGNWKGDFVLFTGAVPDSVLRRTALRSELVVLWRWIDPERFFSSCYDPVAGNYSSWCPNAYGEQAIQQAEMLGRIADRSVQNSGRIGMVVDEGMDDTTIVFPLSDSTTTSYRNMRLWLSSISKDYLDWRIPKPVSGTASGIANNLEISRNRSRFRADIARAGTLYSSDSAVLRELLVVTVGPVPVAGELLEAPDLAALPADVHIGSSQLVASGTVVAGNTVTNATPPVSHWPGVDLKGAVDARAGDGADMVAWNGIPLVRTRERLSGRVTIRSQDMNLSRDIVVAANGKGGLNTSLNAHGLALGDSIAWSLYDEKGDTIALWSEKPDWLDVGGDSVLPRLWGRSSAPISNSFRGIDYGPLFGFVNRTYSLLATPSDTLGRARQQAYADSGIPFLSASDIFWRQGYKTPGTTRVGERRSTLSDPRAIYRRSDRIVSIVFADFEGASVEIRDLRGRVVASIPASALAGMKSFEWRVPASFGRGMLLVTLRAPTGARTLRVLVD